MWSGEAKWIIVFESLYLAVLIVTCVRIIYDTRSVSKTLAYLLFAIFVPVIGIAFYFSFGINYRKRKRYNRKLAIDETIKSEFESFLKITGNQLSQSPNPVIARYEKLIRLLSNKVTGHDHVLPNTEIQLLKNGEELFPVLIRELGKAQRHIHMEYYIYEDDTIGNRIKDLLIQKAKDGVKVRFIYDDFGSRSIRKTIVRELVAAGVQAYPFSKIKLIGLANRLNYRNHRKIVIIDGDTSFTGGINVSDKYINHRNSILYWRDAHLMIRGYSSLALQQVFLSDWNFCSGEDIMISREHFPTIEIPEAEPAYAQVVSSGPDSDLPNILYAVIQSINLAQDEVLLTTPYYIPDNSLQESLVIAALSGVSVKLLVPEYGDSKLVDLASKAYFEDLLRAGVKIFVYKKGFVHAKTHVVDRQLASVGTANLDIRSFDLNFEVSALIYDQKTAAQLADAFDDDLKDTYEITLETWNRRPRLRKITERLVRLISPFM